MLQSRQLFWLHLKLGPYRYDQPRQSRTPSSKRPSFHYHLQWWACRESLWFGAVKSTTMATSAASSTTLPVCACWPIGSCAAALDRHLARADQWRRVSLDPAMLSSPSVKGKLVTFNRGGVALHCVSKSFLPCGSWVLLTRLIAYVYGSAAYLPSSASWESEEISLAEHLQQLPLTQQQRQQQ